MPQLDPLIQAMFQHGADALELQAGQRPSLRLGGAPRPLVKTALTAAHVSRLVSEIAPADQRPNVDSGAEASFTYDLNGRPVEVRLHPGSNAVIRPATAPVATAVAETPRAPAAIPVSEPSPAPFAPAAIPVLVTPVAPPAPEALPASVTPAAPSAPEAIPVSVPPAAPSATAGRVPSIVPGDGRVAAEMDGLLRQLVERGGSDLHLSTDSPPMLRVDGELLPIDGSSALDSTGTEQVLLSIAPERNREQFRDTGDTDFAHEIEGLCRFRSNLFMDRKGPGGVFRVIPSKILTVDDLKLSEAIRQLCFLTKGLVVVTGPTGSGKSTTLCSLVDHINNHRSDHIITIEDPIEFVHPNKKCLINQREVHLHTQGFKPALRAALREDPDVVLVGEMRDLETIAIAIETAETGHLVFGTLHTTSAVSTVDRIIDQFPADRQGQIRVMLSESLRAVIAQVLCKKIGGGRVAALEVLIVNPAISNLIREAKTFQIPSMMQTGRALGNVMMNASLLELVKSKLVEPQEAYLKTMDKQSLVAAFRANQIHVDFLDHGDKQP